MAKSKKKSREAKRSQWKRENEQFEEFRLKAPYLKAVLKGRGCILPFYDFLDSYADEFQRIGASAMKSHWSLLGIHEVEHELFAASDQNWPRLGYADLDQIVFDLGDAAPGYGEKGIDATLAGSMTAFFDANRTVRSVILIRQTVKTRAQHREMKYAFKIASLLHEIGHVHDLEQGLNFDVNSKRLDVIEAEVFANLFALQQMAKRSLFQSYFLLESALRDAIPIGGYIAEVAKRVFERLPRYELTDWQLVLDDPPTHDEMKKLGPRAIQVLTGG
jgi:hypothetical protein